MNLYEINGVSVLPPLSAEYRLDPVLNINQELVATEQGYQFNYQNALQSTLDVSFNKHSNFYLTNQFTFSDVFNIDPLPQLYPEQIVTFLAFNRVDLDPLSALSAESSCVTGASGVSGTSGVSGVSGLSGDIDETTEYITIDNTSTSSTKPVIIKKYENIKLKNTLPDEYYFNVLLIDGFNCLIYHQHYDRRYYLEVDEFNEILFKHIEPPAGLEDNIDAILNENRSDSIKFQYCRFQNKDLIRFFKRDGTDPDNIITSVLELRTIEEREDLKEGQSPLKMESVYNKKGLPGHNTLRYRPQQELNDHYVYQNILNYKQSTNNELLFDENTTTSDLATNMLIHSEYYYLTGESIPYNILPVKNYETASGIISPSNIGDDSQYKHRMYNKMFTGTNQLKGMDKIYFNYITLNSDIIFEPGLTYFNVSQDMGMIDALNINDTNLIQCGSVGGDIPLRSDKIFKKRAGYKDYTKYGDPVDKHGGTWLCTWLSAGDSVDDSPVWMDRYYNPSSSGYVSALEYSNDDNYGVHYDVQQQDIFNSKTPEIWDEPSKLTFEPGCHYAYYRMDQIDIENNVKSLEPYNCHIGFDEYFTAAGDILEPVDSLYDLTQNKIASLILEKHSTATGELAFNFNINCKDWTKPIAHNIFGNYTNKGFSINNMNKVSPFIFLPGADGTPVEVDGRAKKQDSSIRIYDNKFNLYNYVVNSSYLPEGETPGLFKYIFPRNFPDDIWVLSTNGDIIKINQDGVILAVYDFWKHDADRKETDEIVHACIDDRYLYILTHINHGNQTPKDYTIDTFDLLKLAYKRFDKTGCLVNVPVPDEYSSPISNNSSGHGRFLGNPDLVANDVNGEPNPPPNIINIINDPEPYEMHRSIYLAYGDSSVVSGDKIMYKVTGAIDNLSGRQLKHDSIYSYDYKKLELIPGKITEADSVSTKLEIIDWAVDDKQNIWIAHSGNTVAKFNSDRKVLLSVTVEDQEIVSIVMVRELISGKVKQYLNVLGKTIGGDILTVPVINHPTTLPGNPAYAKASSWIDSSTGIRNERPEGNDDIIPINDRDSLVFDDTKDVIYPFVEGDTRFGLHTSEIPDMLPTDTTGQVVDGDYDFITEFFDNLTTEAKDLIFGNIIDVETGLFIDTINLDNFLVDDISDKPQMVNNYEYTERNFEYYEKCNLNLKVKLTPLHGRDNPEMVDLVYDLKKIGIGEHNFNLNINNTTGTIELIIDGIRHDELVYNFDKNKYRFSDYTDNKIFAGASPYLKDTLSCRKLNDLNAMTSSTFYINDLRIYTKCLEHHDILNLMRLKHPLTSLYWTIPSGFRNHIEKIDKVYNHSKPISKSNVLDLRVRNSRILDKNIQTYITSKIRNRLDDIVPAGVKCKNVHWSNQILD